MDKSTPSLATETAALRAVYAALNRNDIEAAVKTFDTQIAWIEPPDYGGTYCGLEAVNTHLSLSRSSWAEGNCEPERFIIAGHKVIVIIYVRVRLKSETEWRVGRHAAVYTFRNSKAIEMRIFDDTQQALEWAGVEMQPDGSTYVGGTQS
jgi:ketosteroid isomerase-like protein